MQNLFNRLFKYKPTKDITPAENFITESFVHLLEYSLENKTAFLRQFLLERLETELGIDDYQNISIDTQRQFQTSDNQTAIPDIVIENKNKQLLYIFEVKYGASINVYDDPENPNEKMHQIDKYQKIGVNKNIYTIVRHHYSIVLKQDNESYKGEILWHNIHLLIKNYESDDTVEKYLHNEFTKFMEDNRMAILKVSKELPEGIRSMGNLFDQISMVLSKLKVKYSASFGQVWLGYYIHLNGSNRRKNGWIGTYWDGDKLIFEYLDERAKKSIKLNMESDFEQSPHDHYCKDFVFEKEEYLNENATDQYNKLHDWINRNIQELKKLCEQ